MSWLAKARSLVGTPFRPSCPPFENALRHVENGEFREASLAVQSLDGMQRFFASFVVELRADELGDIDDAMLAELCCRNTAELVTNLVDASKIPRDMLEGWARKVGLRLPIGSLLDRDKYCRGNSLLCAVVDAGCDAGRWEAAAVVARRIDKYHVEDTARLWARIGSGLPDGALREEALMIAARAGNRRPKIQHGGEEAGAHAAAIEGFARAGLAHDHPAVATAVKGLTKLADSKAPKSAPAHGTRRAIIAACLRAADDADAGWRAVATELQATVFGGKLDDAGSAAALLADLRLGKRIAGKVQRSDNETGHDPVVLRARAEGRWHKAGTPEEVAALRETGREDVEDRVQAFLAEWNGYGHKTVAQFIMGCRLRLPTDRLEALLEAIPERERAEALVEGAAYGLKDDPRRLSYLERGYPEGDRFGIQTASLLPLLTSAMLEKAVEFYGAACRVGTLGVLAAWHLKHGRIPEAVGAIARFTQPKSAGNEAWVPYYRRGQDGHVCAAVDPETVPEAVRKAKHAYELLALAQGLAEASPERAQVMAASRLKKWEKARQLPALVTLRLMDGDFAAAVGYLPRARGSQKNAQTTALRKVAEHLNVRRARIPVALEATWSTAFLDILSATTPQWASPALKHVAEAVAAMSSDSAVQAAAVQRLIEIGERLYPRIYSGDRAAIYTGFSRGYHAVGKQPEAMASMARALDLAGTSGSYYLRASIIGEDLAAMREAWPRAEWIQAVQRAAEISVKLRKHDYEQLDELESITLALWKHGDAHAVNQLLISNPTFPKTLRQNLSRSIWADINLSPDPLVSMEGTWPNEALPKPVLTELMRALSHALKKTGHAEAEAVAHLERDLVASLN